MTHAMTETKPNTARIFAGRNAYYVGYVAGPRRDALIRVVGCAIVPLPYTPEADIAVVLADMRQRVPDTDFRT